MIQSVCILVLLAMVIPARADLQGELRAVFKSASGRVVEDRPIYFGEWNEAFVDYSLFTKSLEQALDGATLLQTSSHGSFFKNALQSPVTKAAFSDATLLLEAGHDYDRIELVFKVMSDRDPLGESGLLAPGGYAGIQPLPPDQIWSHVRIYRVEVVPRLLPYQDYPLLFLVKEKNCRFCLAVAQQLRLVVMNPGPRSAVCDKATQELQWAEANLNQFFTDRHELVSSLATKDGSLSHVQMNKAKMGAKEATIKGICEDMAFGVDSHGTCEALKSIRDAIEEWTQKRNFFVKAVAERCRPY